jgi:hypothetical protein
MYPDVDDVKAVISKHGRKVEAERIWEDVALAWSFLEECRGRCFPDGRHKMIPIRDLKAYATNFIGNVADEGFLVAAIIKGLKRRPQNVDGVAFDHIDLLFPPYQRFDEVRGVLWDKHLAGLRTEISDERKRYAEFKQRFARFYGETK